MVQRKTTGCECSNQEPAAATQPQGARALVGAWRDLNEQQLESLIKEIYSDRQTDLGRRVELDA